MAAVWPLLVMLLSAGPWPASRAAALAQAKDWDQLLIAFAQAKPAAYSKRDAITVASALTQACQALEAQDPVLAFDLGKHAAAFEPLPDALLCWARSAQGIHQASSVEDALRLGLELYRKDGRFGLELGRALLAQGDSDGALAALKAVPPRSPQARDAHALTLRALASARQDAATRKQTLALEGRIESGAPGSPPHPAGGRATRLSPSSGSTVGFESGTGPGDIRTRDSRYFHFKYFNNKRDFGERAEFEGQVADALETSRQFAAAQLGVSRESPVDVILYTREEFALHLGAQTAQSVLGLYSQNAIRINGAMELSPEQRATLTHEYVHAVVHEVAGGHDERVPTWMNEGVAEYLEWRYEGQDDPPHGLTPRLAAMAQRNALPSLASLSRGPLIGHSDPGAMYVYSALAARFLIRQAGANAYLHALRALGEGQPVETVFPAYLGRTLEELDRSLAGELAGR